MALSEIGRIELLKELLRQWAFNHAEYCGAQIEDSALPHRGDCHWPLPSIITDQLEDVETYLAWVQSSGKSVELRLELPAN